MQMNSTGRGALSGRAIFTGGKIGLMAICVSVIVFATGCPSNAPPPANPKEIKPYEGVTLVLAGADAKVMAALGSRARGWATRSGAMVNVRTVDPLTVNDADISVTTAAGVGHFAEANDALPVPEELKSLDHPGQWIRILPVYRDRLAGWAGQPRAIPLAGEGAVLMIRRDLLADPALKEKFLLKFARPLPEQPATWEDVAEIAEACVDLKRAALPARSPDEEKNLTDFFRVAACYDRPALTESDVVRKDAAASSLNVLSFTHRSDSGEPRLTAPGFAAAAAWLTRVAPARLPAGEDGPAALAAGKIPMAVLSLADLGRLPKVNGAVPETFDILPLPGTRTAFDAAGKVMTFAGRTNYVPYFAGGWYGVVRAKCTRPDAAFDLLLDLAGPTRSLELLSDPTLGFGPLRGEHLEQAREMVWQRYGFDAAHTRRLAEALRRNAGSGTINPAFGVRGPDTVALTDLLAASLTNMNAAQSAWMKHDKSVPNAAAVRRHSAGLP